jgi:hypothetical protein
METRCPDLKIYGDFFTWEIFLLQICTFEYHQIHPFYLKFSLKKRQKTRFSHFETICPILRQFLNF